MADTYVPGGTDVIDLLALAGVSSIAVAGSPATARSYSVVLPRGSSFGLEYKFASAGAVDVKMEIEHGNQAPTTEGSSDTAFVTGSGVSAISAGITDTLDHFSAISPIVCQRIRILFTGQGANAASTTVSKLKLTYSKNN